MEKKNSLKNVELASNISTKKKTDMVPGKQKKKIVFSKVFNIIHFFEKNKNNNLSNKILSILTLLSIIEENTSNSGFKKFIEPNDIPEQIEQFKDLITNLKKYSKIYNAIYYIFINKDNDELSIYLVSNTSEYFKYIFKIKNPTNKKNPILHSIEQHCQTENIKFNIDKNKIMSNYYLDIKNYDNNYAKIVSHQYLCALKANYEPYKRDNTKENFNYSSKFTIYEDKSNIFDYNITISMFTNTDIEKYTEENKINIIPICIDFKNYHEKLELFIKNLNDFNENNFENSTVMAFLGKNERFPVIYMQIDDDLFEISFKNPGFLLDEFVLFCEKEHTIIYGRKNENIYPIRYEGKYLGGKRHGIGIEYDYIKGIKSEGEYSKGKKIGKWKEYNLDEILIFEGEYLNGEKNGKGREYNLNGKLIFEGEYKNNKRNGKGIEYFYYAKPINKGDKNDGKDNENYIQKLIFEGEFRDGKRWEGKEKKYNSYEGWIYFEGEYKSGKIVSEKYYDEIGNLLLEKNN